MSTTAAAVSVTGIAYTAYPVRNLRRARAFYEQRLGLAPTLAGRAGAEWVEYRIGAGHLVITNRLEDGGPSAQGAVVALQVERLDAAVAALRADRGVPVAEPVTLTGFRFVLTADPEGNRVMLYERTAPRRRAVPAKPFSHPPTVHELPHCHHRPAIVL
jgi:predicted enzyme related to lactoylglutathione lyase